MKYFLFPLKKKRPYPKKFFSGFRNIIFLLHENLYFREVFLIKNSSVVPMINYNRNLVAFNFHSSRVGPLCALFAVPVPFAFPKVL